MEHTIVMAIATVLGNLIGLFLKKWPNFNTKAIPIVLLVLNGIKLMLVNAGLLPDDVSLAGAGDGMQAIVSLLGDTALMVGVHSSIKNTTQFEFAGKVSKKR